MLAGEPEHDREVFLARVARHAPGSARGSDRGVRRASAASDAAAQALELAAARFAERPADLRLLDLRRHVEPDWFQQPRMLGYAAYTERFAGDLRGVAERIPYLAELGVTYLHLMPLLRPRPAPNDGGYAVMDYRQVREDLGTMADLADLARALRATASRSPWTSSSTTWPASTTGPAGPAPATRTTATTSISIPTARCPTPTRRRCPRSSRISRRAASAGTTRPRRGCGRRSTPGSGT